MVTDRQVKRYRHWRTKGKTAEEAAARAGMTAKTARSWEVGPLPSHSNHRKPHDWRTRKDPFEEVWETQILPLLKRDEDAGLQATTILEDLKAKRPGQDWDRHLRTLQRRVRVWRAQEGPPKEVIFPQDHPPGEEAAYDFTHCEELKVSILGVEFPHMIFECILSFSGHRFVQLAFGETYEALSCGLQDAMWDMGGVPERVRHDNLSAATHNLKALEPHRKLTARYQALVSHYRVDSSRINPGKSNENGVVEKGHDVLKTALDQALRLRGTRDFDSVDAYWSFVLSVKDRLNARCAARWVLERDCLRPLPTTRIPDYTVVKTTVRRWSCIRVANNTYSVPSRLIGEEVAVRVHPDSVEVFYRDKLVDCYPRLRGDGKHRIDFRHIIDSLVRKPGAFANYRYREELFPTLVFRRAYDALVRLRGERAHIDYLQILHLAAHHSQIDVETALELLIGADSFGFPDVEALVKPRDAAAPTVVVAILPQTPSLVYFDELISGECYDCLKERLALAC